MNKSQIQKLINFLTRKGLYLIDKLPSFTSVYNKILSYYTVKKNIIKSKFSILQIIKSKDNYFAVGFDNTNKKYKRSILMLESGDVMSLLKDCEYQCKRTLEYLNEIYSFKKFDESYLLSFLEEQLCNQNCNKIIEFLNNNEQTSEKKEKVVEVSNKNEKIDNINKEILNVKASLQNNSNIRDHEYSSNAKNINVDKTLKLNIDQSLYERFPAEVNKQKNSIYPKRELKIKSENQCHENGNVIINNNFLHIENENIEGSNCFILKQTHLSTNNVSKEINSKVNTCRSVNELLLCNNEMCKDFTNDTYDGINLNSNSFDKKDSESYSVKNTIKIKNLRNKSKSLNNLLSEDKRESFFLNLSISEFKLKQKSNEQKNIDVNCIKKDRVLFNNINIFNKFVAKNSKKDLQNIKTALVKASRKTCEFESSNALLTNIDFTNVEQNVSDVGDKSNNFVEQKTLHEKSDTKDYSCNNNTGLSIKPSESNKLKIYKNSDSCDNFTVVEDEQKLALENEKQYLLPVSTNTKEKINNTCNIEQTNHRKVLANDKIKNNFAKSKKKRKINSSPVVELKVKNNYTTKNFFDLDNDEKSQIQLKKILVKPNLKNTDSKFLNQSLKFLNSKTNANDTIKPTRYKILNETLLDKPESPILQSKKNSKNVNFSNTSIQDIIDEIKENKTKIAKIVNNNKCKKFNIIDYSEILKKSRFKKNN